MNFLYNTKIRTRILILVVIPILAITGLAFERYNNANEARIRLENLRVVMNYLRISSELIDVLQQERNPAMAITSGKNGAQYLKPFELSVLKTDRVLIKFRDYVSRNENDLKEARGIYKRIEKIEDKLTELQKIRDTIRQVTNNMEGGGTAVGSYTQIILRIMESSEEVVFLASADQELSLLSNAYFNFVRGKDNYSFGMGVILRIIQYEKTTFPRSKRFFNTKIIWNESFNEFSSFAPEELSKTFNKTFNDLKSAQDFEALAANIARFGPLEYNVTSDDWYSRTLKHWQLLSTFDTKVRDYILKKTNTRLSDAETTVRETLIFLTLLLTSLGVLAFLILRSILSPLQTLVGNFETIATTKNLDHLVPVVGKDEFANASSAFNVLIGNLREKNTQINAMLTNMKQGLFTIDANGCIGEEYSSHLEEIFESSELCGLHACELLFSNSDLGGDLLNQIQEALNAMVGEDPMNFEFNRHLLVGEYTKEITGNKKILTLEWNPIIVDDEIETVMVTVRDVTKLKAMEAEMQETMRELNIIHQLLNVPAKKFLNFAKTTKQFIEENYTIIKREKLDKSAVEQLFRNMHTIKGNARTFGFSTLSDAAHAAESIYSQIKDTEAPYRYETSALLSDLEQLNAVLENYNHVYLNVLGRSDSSERDANGFWLDSDKISALRQIAENIEAEYASTVTTILDKGISVTLQDVLADTIASLPEIAKELGKAIPETRIVDNGVHLHKQIESLLQNVFTHLFRNSIDHGIETEEERLIAGKKERGLISVSLIEDSGHYALRIGDDGRGLAIATLFNKGVELGKWKGDQKIDCNEIAELIFLSGTSTKDKITSISGRGVGMDAVKSFIEQQGGSININLLGSPTYYAVSNGNTFIKFEFILHIPTKFIVLSRAA